ncbi:hypothetical protein [Candidatus Berkiella aquae]|uniref:Uncharacterized protein n=1 Tax=Candidatus Berkiella aquae TaxID=295108 RepID=A0A0Q9YVL8_9GAMM|nr:hypothetical protein [Candidatus Berkiella aquae]MCS5711460.1 hypothetical protein [Candidatus Berkiella aquae]
MINKQFGLYQIRFSPPPSIPGPIRSFDTVEEAKEYINTPKDPLIGDAWIIVESTNGGNHKFIECIPIKTR